MKNKPKSLGEIAYETRYAKTYPLRLPWSMLHEETRSLWEKTAKAVERAVVRKLKREGKIK